MATTTSLSFHIFGHYHGSPAFQRARRDMTRLNDQFHQGLQRSQHLARSFRLLTTAAFALGPALIPIGAAALNVAAGFTAMGVAVGAAIGIYGAALKGAASRATEWK